MPLIRSSHQRCSIKKCVLENFVKFTGKRLCQSLFFNKVACLRSATLLKTRLWHSCFPVNFEEFLGTPFLQITFGRLLLNDRDFVNTKSSSNLPTILGFGLLIKIPWHLRIRAFLSEMVICHLPFLSYV